MHVSILCTWCGHQLEVADDLAGATVSCPKCGTVCGVSVAAGAPPTSKPKKPRVYVEPPPAAVAAVDERITAKTSSTAIKPASAVDDDETDNPYEVAKARRLCPECG